VSTHPDTGLTDEVALRMLESAETRRQSLDEMMWQVPGLSLAAQSFLLTIALGDTSTPLARLASGTLAFVASISTIQLLLKQRFHELEWSRWLENLADDHGWPLMHNHVRSGEFAWRPGKLHEWQAPISGYSPNALARRLRARMVSRRSPNVWVLTLTIFAIADFAAAIYGVALLLR
jgi:hypothetical protein